MSTALAAVGKPEGVARWIYAVTTANLSRREGCDLFQISDAPIVELIQAT